MPLSARTRHEDEPNALTRAVAARRARGEPLLDLTVSNPTTCGLPYDEDAILDALASRRALVYAPEPLGVREARAAGAAAAFPVPVDPGRVALTASTSEAYAVLFKLLCDPGDEVLVPVPSYPLLSWLAGFEAVKLVTYPLVYAGGWHVDLDALRRALSPRTRAIVVVSPNNPTGSYLGREELSQLLDHGVPLISDEVFSAYPLDPRGVPEDRIDTVLRAERGLVFALSGLSKLAGLPQMKLGFVGVGGDAELAEAAMARLEIVLDAYLSVSAPVQHAAARLLAAGKTTRDAIAARTRENLAAVRRAASATGSATVLDVEGGWYATLRVPDTRTDEDWATSLVTEDGVFVHPGYFFDMHRGAHLVVSLLTPERDLEAGMRRIMARVNGDG